MTKGEHVRPAVPLHTAYFFMLNYDAMKRLNLNACAALLVLVALFSACSGPEENSGSSNTNAPQQANSNSSAQPQIAQNNAPAVAPGTVPAVQPIPPPPSTAEKSADAGKAAGASAVDGARAPKLVVPEKTIDYGKQPQEKTLVRAIAVKNGGRADLKILSVTPS